MPIRVRELVLEVRWVRTSVSTSDEDVGCLGHHPEQLRSFAFGFEDVSQCFSDSQNFSEQQKVPKYVVLKVTMLI